MSALLEVPSEMDVPTAAEKFRVLQNDGGGYTGSWRNALAPYLVGPMQSLNDPRYEMTVFVGPAQSGKTEIGLNWMTHCALVDTADLQIVLPEKQQVEDFSVRRMDRAVNASPALKAAAALGKRVDTKTQFDFGGKSLVTLAWPTSANASSKPVPRNWLDETDSMAMSVGAMATKPGEGDPIDLFHKRSQTFGTRRHTLVTSSPKHSPTRGAARPAGMHEMPTATGITSRYNSGTRRLLYWQCEDSLCGEWFVTRIEDLIFNESAAYDDPHIAVHFACPHCGELHDEFARKRMLGGARWLAEGQTIDRSGVVAGNVRQSLVDSYWLYGTQAAFIKLDEIVRKKLTALKFLADTGSDTMLRAFMNVDAGELYVPKTDGDEPLTPELLRAAATDLPLGIVPDWARAVVAAVDIQADRFEVQWQAIGPGGQSAIIDHQRLVAVTVDGKPVMVGGASNVAMIGAMDPVDPAQRIDHWMALIPAVFERALPMAADPAQAMRPIVVAMDTGGPSGTADKAYKFSRYLRRDKPALYPRAMFVKGRGGRNPVRIMRAQWDPKTASKTGANRTGVDLWFLFVDELKDAVDGMLRGLVKVSRRDHGDGSHRVDSVLHLSRYLPTAVFDQLCAEVRDGETWVNQRRVSNEAFDLAVYCKAAALRIGADKIDWADASVIRKLESVHVRLASPVVAAMQRDEAARTERAVVAQSAMNSPTMRRRGVRGNVVL